MIKRVQILYGYWVGTELVIGALMWILSGPRLQSMSTLQTADGRCIRCPCALRHSNLKIPVILMVYGDSWCFMVAPRKSTIFDNPRFTQNIFQKSHVWLPFLGHWIPKIRRDGFPLYSAIVRWFFRFLGFGVKLFSTFIVKFYHCWLSSATSWLCIEFTYDGDWRSTICEKIVEVCLFGQKMTQIYGSRMASYFLVSLSITCVPL